MIQNSIFTGINRKKRNVYGSRVRPKLSFIQDENYQIDLEFDPKLSSSEAQEFDKRQKEN
jgi:hypothetical protein